MAANAQAQAEATKEAQKPGIEHAKAERPTVYRGQKPDITRAQFTTVREMVDQGASMQAIAAAAGLSRQSVYRLRDDPARAERMLSWEAA